MASLDRARLQSRRRLAAVETIGHEHPTFSPGKTGVSGEGGADPGAVGAPDLAEVVESWPMLPEGTRADTLGIVRAFRRS